jgi:putative Holliday junction resolvase
VRALGLDLGEKSLGIAITDSAKQIVNPLENFRHDGKNIMVCIHRVQKIMKDYGDVDLIILGDPYYNKPLAKRADKFVVFFNLLKQNLDKNLKIVLFDEHRTTKNSISMLKDLGLKGSQIKKIIDKVSATEILSNYLSFIKPNPNG